MKMLNAVHIRFQLMFTFCLQQPRLVTFRLSYNYVVCLFMAYHVLPWKQPYSISMVTVTVV